MRSNYFTTSYAAKILKQRKACGKTDQRSNRGKLRMYVTRWPLPLDSALTAKGGLKVRNMLQHQCGVKVIGAQGIKRFTGVFKPCILIFLVCENTYKEFK